MGLRLALVLRLAIIICTAFVCFPIVSTQMDWADDDEDPGKFYVTKIFTIQNHCLTHSKGIHTHNNIPTPTPLKILRLYHLIN